MSKTLRLLYLTFCITALAACQPARQETTEGGDTIPMAYAKNITMVRHDGFTLVSLRNPWDTTAVLHQYALTDEEGRHNPAIPSTATIVKVPLSKAAVFTAVHCALLKDLGVEARIGGVADLEYIYLPFVREGVKKGHIADLGKSMEPNMERVMQLEPDALMPSPFQNSGGYGRLENIGIPIVECADYMEVSPLAGAEWMKFYGRLFGVEERADSLFATIEKEYLSLKATAEQTAHRPTLLVERMSGASWHMPGGNSTMGILYHDAGADYLWADTPNSGSTPMSFESVFERGLNADFWLLKYNQDGEMTYEQLEKDNKSYTKFKAFREHRVYGCNTSTTNFYEETPFHPERLLASLIQIFHPELSVSAKKQYFCPLK